MRKQYTGDIEGNKYNMLTAIRFIGRRPKNNGTNQTLPYWECLCDCGNTVEVAQSHFTSGNTKSCGCKASMNAVKVGQKFTNKFGEYEVIEKNGGAWYTVKFSDGFTKKSTDKTIREGKVKNPYAPFVKGVGYIGEGRFYCRDGKNYKPEYEIWNGVLKRCYDQKFQTKHKTYVGCSVEDSWLNFQNFAEWYTSQPNYGDKQYHLDKDLVVLGNKIYSAETCRLIPQEINSLFTGSSNTNKGVHFCNTKRMWIAQCHKGELTSKGNPKQSYLGAYKTELEARKAYAVCKTEKAEELIEKYKDSLDTSIIENIRILCSRFIGANAQEQEKAND